MSRDSNKLTFGGKAAAHAVPHGLSLYKFQKEAVQSMLAFLHANETHSVYNASEMGLGKSIQTIVTLNMLEAKRVLVICPAVMRLVWEDEFKKWSTVPRIKHVVLSGKDDPAKCSRCDLVIVSYDMASNGWDWVKVKRNGRPTKIRKVKDGVLRELLAKKFDAIVCDELHYCKNRESIRSQVVLGKLWDNAHYHIGLSGTPFTTRVVDGYTAFHAMLPSRFKGFWEFAQEFSYITRNRFGHDFYGVKRPKRLSRILRQNFYIRFLKKDVLPDLPPKTFTRISLAEEYSVSAPDRKYEEQLKLEAYNARKAIEEDREPHIPPTLAEHRKLQGIKKLPPILEFIEDKLEQDIPLIVFAWHKDVIETIRKYFATYKPAVITGDTPPKARHSEMKRFQREETNLFLGNMKAGGIGITLVRSSHVVIAEPDWSPTTVDQATDRSHRIGQKDPVNVYYFIVKNSIDEVMINTVMNRVRVFKKVLDGDK